MTAKKTPAAETAPEVTETVEASAPAREIPEGHVVVIVTKKGIGKVYRGEEPRVGVEPETFKWREEIVIPLEIAKELEDRGFVEIEEAE